MENLEDVMILVPYDMDDVIRWADGDYVVEQENL
jgi:hypothetical protein